MRRAAPDDGMPGSSAQYASPILGGGGSAACMSGAVELGGEPPRKLSRTGCAGECVALHPNVSLTPTQHEALDRVVGGLNLDTASVVVTNPLQQDNPIVFVTKTWEEMCGFRYSEAVGRNARITQGQRSDPAVTRLIGGALRDQRACKVMTLNYRGGLESRPFWNMLSISPVVHSGQLQLYLANLQDYTYHMSKLVSLPPAQFCRSAEYHQRTCVLPPEQLHARFFARPAVIETSAALVPGAAPVAADAESAALMPHLKMKRLGWSNLELEPEHLTDRVVDALHSLEARYERVESSADEDDVFVVNAQINGVAARLLVSRDPDAPSSYRVTCTRLGGDTFAYHEAFRQLRQLLGDAVQGGTALRGAGAGSSFTQLGQLGGRMGLAPLPASAMLAMLPAAAASPSSSVAGDDDGRARPSPSFLDS